MKSDILKSAIDKLSRHFAARNWKYLDIATEKTIEKSFAWPGSLEENIMICVHKGKDIRELFHRQDFFFFNFAYEGNYSALSYKSNNYITIQENECYIGQPFSGYALYAHSEKEFTIIGILIQKETFFKIFLPILSADTKLFRFFLNAQTNKYSEEFIHLHFNDTCNIRTLLEMMVIEYANPQEDTQAVLQPMVLTLLMYVARQYKLSEIHKNETLSDKIIRYISEHNDCIKLKDVARHFSYHPNYVSALLHRELGKSFSEIVLEQRMEKAVSLLKNTSLSIEKIAGMLGYSNSSNFYKAFRKYYQQTPREFISTQK